MSGADSPFGSISQRRSTTPPPGIRHLCPSQDAIHQARQFSTLPIGSPKDDFKVVSSFDKLKEKNYDLFNSDCLETEKLLSTLQTTESLLQAPKDFDRADQWMEEWISGMGGMELEDSTQPRNFSIAEKPRDNDIQFKRFKPLPVIHNTASTPTHTHNRSRIPGVNSAIPPRKNPYFTQLSRSLNATPYHNQDSNMYITTPHSPQYSRQIYDLNSSSPSASPPPMYSLKKTLVSYSSDTNIPVYNHSYVHQSIPQNPKNRLSMFHTKSHPTLGSRRNNSHEEHTSRPNTPPSSPSVHSFNDKLSSSAKVIPSVIIPRGENSPQLSPSNSSSSLPHTHSHYRYRHKAKSNRHRVRSTSWKEDDLTRYEIFLDRVGDDMRTTLMIKNIPNKYDQEMLLESLNKKFKGTYDFFYLPIDFKNKCNVGYAFINFIDYRTVAKFYEELNQKKWEKFNSEKVCHVTYARIQGKLSFIDHFRNSSLMYEDPSCRPLIFHSSGPSIGMLEAFPPANVTPHSATRGAAIGLSSNDGMDSTDDDSDTPKDSDSDVYDQYTDTDTDEDALGDPHGFKIGKGINGKEEDGASKDGKHQTGANLGSSTPIWCF